MRRPLLNNCIHFKGILSFVSVFKLYTMAMMHFFAQGQLGLCTLMSIDVTCL